MTEKKIEQKNDFLAEGSVESSLFSQAEPSLAGRIPTELSRIEMCTRPITICSDDYQLGDWQETPSKIVYHDGWYHIWIIDIPLERGAHGADDGHPRIVPSAPGMSTTRYLKSKDGVTWLDQGRIPSGEAGAFDDDDRLAPDVILHDGRFYLFCEVRTDNTAAYGQNRCGIGCLVADVPEGPWRYASDKLLLTPESDNPDACDHRVVTNPRIERLNGKWFMYYKALQYHWDDPCKPKDYVTTNAIAVADFLLGPYTKFEGNPISIGHSAFLLKYGEGLLYFNDSPEEIYWTEDGFRFLKIGKYGTDTTGICFEWSSFFIPNNPLYGGDPSLPDAREFWGITSSWRSHYGYYRFNNDILGLTLSLGGIGIDCAESER